VCPFLTYLGETLRADGDKFLIWPLLRLGEQIVIYDSVGKITLQVSERVVSPGYFSAESWFESSV
jgi:hypothetical protein